MDIPKNLPWIIGTCFLCSIIVSKLATNYCVNSRLSDFLAKGMQPGMIPKWVSLLYMVGHLGMVICGIWSFEIAWWLPFLLLVAYLLQMLTLPSALSDVLKHRAAQDLAQGSELHRNLITAAMSQIEATRVQDLRAKLSAEDQMRFMMAYECFVMWAINLGLQKVLNAEGIQAALRALYHHFEKHGWYRADAFEKIWAETEKEMPEYAFPMGVVPAVR